MPNGTRSDVSDYLIHLTKGRTGKGRHWEPRGFQDAVRGPKFAPLSVLGEILKDGVVKGSNNHGHIKGTRTAACFTETPLSNVQHIVSRYSYYRIAVSKRVAFDAGARPVIYLPDAESGWIPAEEKWRHMRFDGGVDFTWEREWRLQGDFPLHSIPSFQILVWNRKDAESLAIFTGTCKNFTGHLAMEQFSCDGSTTDKS